MTITEQIRRVAEHRDRTLARRSTAEIIEWIAAAADLWRSERSSWLERAASEGSAATGFSPEMIRLGLRDFFEDVTRSTLSAWVYGELGGGLDGWQHTGRSACAAKYRLIGPRVVTHVFAGNVPNAALQSLLSGLLVKAANICKCAAGDPILPRLFAQSLTEVDEDLGRCVAFLDWKGGDALVEQEAWTASDSVIVHGSDETVISVRRRILPQTQLLAYGHRVSFACIGRDALTGETLPQLAEAAAYDVSIWDQHGCLSPHCIYVEEGGSISPLEFADMLAVEMGRFEARHPRGSVSVEESAAFMKLRGAYEFRASTDSGVRVYAGEERNRWAVIFERDQMWATSCLNRLVFVKPIGDFSELRGVLRPVREHLSTAGIAIRTDRRQTVADLLAESGVTRICDMGQMQKPPLCWHHDGQPTLGRLVRWVDLETGRILTLAPGRR